MAPRPQQFMDATACGLGQAIVRLSVHTPGLTAQILAHRGGPSRPSSTTSSKVRPRSFLTSDSFAKGLPADLYQLVNRLHTEKIPSLALGRVADLQHSAASVPNFFVDQPRKQTFRCSLG